LRQSCKARIVLVAQDEGVVEEARDTRIASAPGPIEPLEGRRGIATQRVDFCDLKSPTVRILLDKRRECRIARASVTADLPCERERDIP